MRTGVRTVLLSAQIGLWGVLGIGLLAGAGVRSETRPAPPLSANEVQELQAKLDKDIAELTRQKIGRAHV